MSNDWNSVNTDVLSYVNWFWSSNYKPVPFRLLSQRFAKRFKKATLDLETFVEYIEKHSELVAVLTLAGSVIVIPRKDFVAKYKTPEARSDFLSAFKVSLPECMRINALIEASVPLTSPESSTPGV